MESRIEETITRHDKGFNCAQAVACTYCDLAGIDEETMFRITEGYGLGMGSMNATCGAVTGACAVVGALNSCGDLEKPVSKGATYKLSREITDRFLEKNSTITCKELKGIETGKMIRSCPDCIRDAARILEGVLEKMLTE